MHVHEKKSTLNPLQKKQIQLSKKAKIEHTTLLALLGKGYSTFQLAQFFNATTHEISLFVERLLAKGHYFSTEQLVSPAKRKAIEEAFTELNSYTVKKIYHELRHREINDITEDEIHIVRGLLKRDSANPATD